MKRSQDTKRPHSRSARPEKRAHRAWRFSSIPAAARTLARYLPLTALALFLIFAVLASFLPRSAASAVAAYPVDAPRVVWREAARAATGQQVGDEIDFVRSFGRAPFPAAHDESTAWDPAGEARLSLPRW